jgi:hypothetical protein
MVNGSKTAYLTKEPFLTVSSFIDKYSIRAIANANHYQ